MRAFDAGESRHGAEKFMGLAKWCMAEYDLNG
jgi:hypothetical protein